MRQHVVTVGLLASYLRELFESDELLADLWIEGEVSDAFVARSGHVYFTLRDAQSQLKCVLFRAQAQRLRQPPRPGDQLAVHGRVSIYERDGTYQLYVDFIQPAGIGIIALQRELLRQQLAAEGLFDPARKRPIPAMPATVGVVASAEGSVWHDIQHVFRRRFPLVHLVLAAAAVQGDRAPAAIAAALQTLQDDGRAEVVIVARGGGSAEDLSAFDDERVVRAVFACRVPVVSGVGHETDWTLIDDVADLRAPTPSAAAELCSPSIVDLAERLIDLQDDLSRTIGDVIGDERRAVGDAIQRLDRRSPAPRIDASRLRVLASAADLDKHLGNRLSAARAAVRRAHVAHRSAIARELSARRGGVERQRLLVEALEPRRTMGRGYALVTGERQPGPLKRIRDYRRGDRVTIRLVDGVVAAEIASVAPGQPAARGAAHA